MKLVSILYFLVLFAVQFAPDALAQNILDDNLDEDQAIDSSDTPSGEKAPNLATETIKSISSSQKIFIITNENQSFGNGDFISLLLENKLVARALVAKNTEAKLSGIKIVKVYALDLWKQLSTGKEVQVLRGDDSYFSAQKIAEKNAKNKVEDTSKLKSEEDLYNSTTLADGDDSSLEENTRRHIKTDNLLALNVGLIDGITDTQAATRYTHLNGSWAYQISDDVWAEFMLGSNTVRDFPATLIDTRMTAYSVRAKYTIAAPFYSYIQPYLGYQIITAQSPGAQTATEFALVDKLAKSRIVAGASLLRRIVPGWFLRVDFGSDLINGGLQLEF